MRRKLYWIYKTREEEHRDSYYGTYTVKDSIGYVRLSKLDLRLLIKILRTKSRPDYGEYYWYEECAEFSISQILKKVGVDNCKIKDGTFQNLEKKI